MMTTNEYLSRRDGLLQAQAPYVVMGKDELMCEGNNFYNVRGMSVQVAPYVQDQLDRLIGLTARQKQGLMQAYGEDAMLNVRNSFAMANCVANPKRFALIANPNECIVDGIVPIEEEAIPMRSFFNVVEMLADKHSYEIDKIQQSYNAAFGITVVMMPLRPEHDAPFNDDEYVTNGLYLKWNLGEMEIGNYYLRLVCTNGQVQLSQNALERVHRVDDKNMMRLIDTKGKAKLMSRNWTKFKTAATLAKDTTASLSEVRNGRNLLLRHGAPLDLAEKLMPYQRLLDMYKSEGFDHVPATQAKSDLRMYDLYNRLTDFASHTDLWQETDNRSASLMQESMGLLMRKRDILTYYDIFG